MQIEQYIAQATRHWTSAVGQGSFWVLHLDTLLISLVIAAAIAITTLLIVRHSTPGQVTPAQNALELYYEWIEEKVTKSYGKPDLWLISIAFTLFLWVLGMNLMDLVPSSSSNFLRVLTHRNLNFTLVPTEDINLTLALGVAVLLITNAFSFVNYGAKGFIQHLLFQPFGAWALPFNIFYNLVEQSTRSFCLALRLFGNMFSGGLIFLVLAVFPVWVQVPAMVIWSITHAGILLIQALLFTELTIVYINPSPHPSPHPELKQ